MQSAEQTTAPTNAKMYWKEYRFARRKGDKTGPLVGGMIVIWLGITLYLSETTPFVGSSWWAYFFIGIGVILIGSGLLRWSQYEYRYPPTGYLVGGGFLLIIGLAAVIRASFFGPGVLIAIGLVIIVLGTRSMRNKPTAQSTPAPQTQT